MLCKLDPVRVAASGAFEKLEATASRGIDNQARELATLLASGALQIAFGLLAMGEDLNGHYQPHARISPASSYLVQSKMFLAASKVNIVQA